MEVLCLDALTAKSHSFEGAMACMVREEERRGNVVGCDNVLELMVDDLANFIYTSGTTGKLKVRPHMCNQVKLSLRNNVLCDAAQMQHTQTLMS